MIVVNIGDLLDRITGSEQRLERYYADIRDRSRDNDLRLLTYYLGTHHRHLPDVLKEYSPPLIKRIRSVALKRGIPVVPEKEFPAIGTPPDKVRGQQLLQAAINYDAALVHLYRKILKQLLIAPAHALFDGLIHVEERDLVMLKKMAAMKYF